MEQPLYLQLEALESELIMRRVGAPSISDENDPRRVEFLALLEEGYRKQEEAQNEE